MRWSPRAGDRGGHPVADRAGPRPRSRLDQGRLLDVGDRALRPVDSARLRDGFLDARRDLEPEVPRDVRVLGPGHDHAPDVAEALERVRGEDAVDGVEGVATAVRLDIVRAARQVLREARGYLVGVARLVLDALPHFGV